jgi:hypothetical protein
MGYSSLCSSAVPTGVLSPPFQYVFIESMSAAVQPNSKIRCEVEASSVASHPGATLSVALL